MAIAQIYDEMPQRAQGKGANPPAWDWQHEREGEGGFPSVKEMKADRAAIRVKDRISEQMIEVDYVRAGDDQSRNLPIVAPDDRGNQERRDPMSAIMQDGLEDIQLSYLVTLNLFQGPYLRAFQLK